MNRSYLSIRTAELKAFETACKINNISFEKEAEINGFITVSVSNATTEPVTIKQAFSLGITMQEYFNK